jgi:hypothetical protein
MSEPVTLYPLINPNRKQAVGNPIQFVERAWCATHDWPIHDGLRHCGFKGLWSPVTKSKDCVPWIRLVQEPPQ